MAAAELRDLHDLADLKLVYQSTMEWFYASPRIYGATKDGHVLITKLYP